MEDDMQLNNTFKLILTGLLLLSVLACTVTFTAVLPAPTSPAFTESTTVPPVQTPMPPNIRFIISSLNLNETSQNAEYTVNAQYPAILDTEDPLALAFNDQMYALVQDEIADFKLNVLEAPKNPVFAASSLEVRYSLVHQNGSIASIKFDFAGYISGAAHPYLYSVTANYHFDQRRKLSLDDLFLPGSNYLEIISTYCIAQLSQRDIGFDKFSTGAMPAPENYRNWNLTSQGLLITFDAYQVAPGAAGPQMVIVPFSEWRAVLDPQGPLG
jgi:hypothetical protein